MSNCSSNNNWTVLTILGTHGLAEEAIALGKFGRAVEAAFLAMPYTEGIAQCLLNLVVLASIVAILVKRGDSSTEKPAFIFIGSLAASDLVQFFALIALVLNYGTHVGKTITERRQHCFGQLSLWIFCISSNLFCTVAITVDRYIYISQCLRYPSLVTQERAFAVALITWLLALAVSILPLLMQYESPAFVGNCVFNHLVPPSFTFATASTILLTLVLTYALYGAILLKYRGKRRRLQEARKKTSRLNSREKSCRRRKDDIKKTLLSVGGFIRAAQYVVFLVLAFTVAWLPYIIVMYEDVIRDLSGVSHTCPAGEKQEDIIGGLDVSQLVQHFIHSGADEPLPCGDLSLQTSCAMVHKAIHEYRQNYRQLLAVTVGVLHSVINPIVYAFWYPQFRMQGRSLIKLCCRKMRIRQQIGLAI